MQIPLVVKELVFLNTPLFFRRFHHIKGDLPADSLLIFTVSFNSLETIKVQVEYLDKNLRDNYQYIVCDNSSDTHESKKIEHYCKQSKVGYIRLRGNPYNGIDASKSHGIAINWMYRRVVKPSNAEFFGIIDHDIFPIKKTSIINKLRNSKVFGHTQVRGDRWYIWPGFSFFNRVLVGQKIYDFMPVAGLDTGGGNWESIFRLINKSRVITPKHEYIKYKDGDTIQSTSMEMIGDWLHLINGSGWRDGKKKANIAQLIQKVLDKDKIHRL